MRYFPQFANRGAWQLPVKKRLEYAYPINHMMSGPPVCSSITYRRQIRWEMIFSGLEDGERSVLESFFLECGGQKESFLFVDPAANLLKAADAVGGLGWETDGALSVTPGVDDPRGGLRAVRLTNIGQTAQKCGQTISSPASYAYTFGVTARADIPATVVLRCRGGLESVESVHTVGPSWQMLSLTGDLNSVENQTTFEIEVAPGVAVEVFLPQVKLGWDVGAVLDSDSLGGIYPNTRFATGTLQTMRVWKNNSAMTVSLVSRLGS